MRNKDKSTFRKIEFHRKESFYLLVRGLEVGIASGLIAVLYRFLLSFAAIPQLNARSLSAEGKT